MCINHDPCQDKPYNKSNIRWKTLDCDSGTNTLHSTNTGDKWTIGAVKRARDMSSSPNVISNGAEDIGIHVYVTRKDAIRANKGKFSFLVKVEVSGFNSGGSYSNRPCETWKRAKLLEVYTPSGRTNITKRFIRK